MTIQGPVQKPQPDGMPHRGRSSPQKGGVVGARVTGVNCLSVSGQGFVHAALRVTVRVSSSTFRS